MAAETPAGQRLLVVQGASSDAVIVRFGLSTAGYEVELSGAGDDVVPRSASADLTIVDGALVRGAAQICRTLRGRGVPRPILVLSRRPSIGEEVEVLEAGADDYLPIPHDLATLVARVRALLRRAGDAEIVVGRIRFLEHEQSVVVDGVARELTRREHALMRILSRHPDLLVTRQEILACWRMRQDMISNVIDVHVARLREKLGPAGSQLETVRGRGLRLRSR